MFNFAILLALLIIGSSAANVHKEVFEKLSNGQKANIWVQLPNKKFNPIAPEHLQNIVGRDNRRLAHFKIMTEYANSMQGPLNTYLSESGAKFKKFWITNAFVIYDADIEIIRDIERQFPVIEEIYVEQMASIDIPVQQNIEENAAPNTIKLAGWNIEQTNAPAAWARGYNGTGFVLGNIDTGVRFTHVALQANYRGNYDGTHNYNWHDPRDETVGSEPFDNNGHGTHVMGSMAGSYESGIGMAYGATWIAAKGCASSSCSQADLTSSGQFMAAPTTTSGGSPDPLKAPHVVQNSWGGGGGQTWFHAIVDSWLALDIVPSFSAGNSGPSCGSIGSPADYEYSLAVASNDQSRSLSSFSSRGAGYGSNHPWALQKPDISGPGSSIRSAWNTNDNAYNTISGTSMSGPHIAASAALILGPFGPSGSCPTSKATAMSCDNINNCLCVEYFRETITVTASSDFQSPAGVPTTCDGVSWSAIPSYHYGYGILDVSTALNAAEAAANKQ
eukprot:c52232_g1_i1.p1 GENE.c52232_g1_i1~~c52232_g1_i1.p1  ORF type:complete len:503 (+),score=33.88 c52232_g1_i1:62-1570(+)